VASVVIAYMAAVYSGRVTLLQLSIARHGAHLPYHGCEPTGVIPLLTVTHRYLLILCWYKLILLGDRGTCEQLAQAAPKSAVGSSRAHNLLITLPYHYAIEPHAYIGSDLIKIWIWLTIQITPKMHSVSSMS